MLLQVEVGDVESELVDLAEFGLDEFFVDVGSERFLEELAVLGHLDRFVEIVRQRRNVQSLTLDRRKLIKILRHRIRTGVLLSTPSSPAESITLKARYGLHVGSGKRSSIRVATSLPGLYCGIRTAADRFRSAHAMYTGAS